MRLFVKNNDKNFKYKTNDALFKQFSLRINRGFPKVDHSGIDARIVSEQNKFSKKNYL